MQHAYFPTTAIVSLLYVLESGASAEIAGVGNEGVVGISLFMGGDTTPSSAVVQTAGHAYRLERRVLKEEFDRGGLMQRLLLRYTQALITQMMPDRGVQSAPFGRAAAVPLAVADARSHCRRTNWS